MFDDLIEAPREAPDLSAYPDAFEREIDDEYLPQFRVGDEIFFERWSTMLPQRRWLSTNKYTVKKIDYGRLWLYNEEFHSWELTDFIRGLKEHGFRYKLTKKMKKPSEGTSVRPLSDSLPHKKRGRPKGSKNKTRRG